ncbi:MAG: TrkA-N domain protein [Candidatus Brocadiaceae bacterium]|nr:TrkA-N domain protein [Candidatus Brocadiaceae bacterium]
MGHDVHQRVFRRFLFPIISLAVLLVAGTAGYRWMESLGTIDALYMTVITISTVGFGEVKPLSPTGRLFTIGLIFSGGGLVAYTLSGTAAFVLSGEWRANWARKKRHSMLAHISHHVIICGYGRVGRHVAHELKAEGIPFVVVDLSPEKIADITDSGYLALQGDASSEADLKEAGIDRARGLVAAANSDAENVFIVLTARSMRKDLLIVARANFEESESKLLRAGANRLILPYRIAGRRMVTMLVRIHLMPASPLVGKTLAEAQLPGKLGITVVACKLPNGQLNIRIGPDTVLQANAQLIALGTPEQLQALIRLAQG